VRDLTHGVRFLVDRLPAEQQQQLVALDMLKSKDRAHVGEAMLKKMVQSDRLPQHVYDELLGSKTKKLRERAEALLATLGWQVGDDRFEAFRLIHFITVDPRFQTRNVEFYLRDNMAGWMLFLVPRSDREAWAFDVSELQNYLTHNPESTRAGKHPFHLPRHRTLGVSKAWNAAQWQSAALYIQNVQISKFLQELLRLPSRDRFDVVRLHRRLVPIKYYRSQQNLLYRLYYWASDAKAYLPGLTVAGLPLGKWGVSFWNWLEFLFQSDLLRLLARKLFCFLMYLFLLWFIPGLAPLTLYRIFFVFFRILLGDFLHTVMSSATELFARYQHEGDYVGPWSLGKFLAHLSMMFVWMPEGLFGGFYRYTFGPFFRVLASVFELLPNSFSQGLQVMGLTSLGEVVVGSLVVKWLMGSFWPYVVNLVGTLFVSMHSLHQLMLSGNFLSLAGESVLSHWLTSFLWEGQQTNVSSLHQTFLRLVLSVKQKLSVAVTFLDVLADVIFFSRVLVANWTGENAVDLLLNSRSQWAGSCGRALSSGLLQYVRHDNWLTGNIPSKVSLEYRRNLLGESSDTKELLQFAQEVGQLPPRAREAPVRQLLNGAMEVALEQPTEKDIIRVLNRAQRTIGNCNLDTTGSTHQILQQFNDEKNLNVLPWVLHRTGAALHNQAQKFGHEHGFRETFKAPIPLWHMDTFQPDANKPPIDLMALSKDRPELKSAIQELVREAHRPLLVTRLFGNAQDPPNLKTYEDPPPQGPSGTGQPRQPPSGVDGSTGDGSRSEGPLFGPPNQPRQGAPPPGSRSEGPLFGPPNQPRQGAPPPGSRSEGPLFGPPNQPRQGAPPPPHHVAVKGGRRNPPPGNQNQNTIPPVIVGARTESKAVVVPNHALCTIRTLRNWCDLRNPPKGFAVTQQPNGQVLMQIRPDHPDQLRALLELARVQREIAVEHTVQTIQLHVQNTQNRELEVNTPIIEEQMKWEKATLKKPMKGLFELLKMTLYGQLDTWVREDSA